MPAIIFLSLEVSFRRTCNVEKELLKSGEANAVIGTHSDTGPISVLLCVSILSSDCILNRNSVQSTVVLHSIDRAGSCWCCQRSLVGQATAEHTGDTGGAGGTLYFPETWRSAGGTGVYLET